MNTFTLLAWISVIGASALFIALVLFLNAIDKELEKIGGHRKTGYGAPASYLSKIRLGVRAIEVQTGALPHEVITLNGGLSAVRDGLGVIDSNLDGVIRNVSAQGAA